MTSGKEIADISSVWKNAEILCPFFPINMKTSLWNRSDFFLSLLTYFSHIWKWRTKQTTAHKKITRPLTFRSRVSQAHCSSVSLLLSLTRNESRELNIIFSEVLSEQWNCTSLAMCPLREWGNRMSVVKTKLYKIPAGLQPTCSRSVKYTYHDKKPQHINGNSMWKFFVISSDCQRPKTTRKGENLH